MSGTRPLRPPPSRFCDARPLLSLAKDLHNCCQETIVSGHEVSYEPRLPSLLYAPPCTLRRCQATASLLSQHVVEQIRVLLLIARSLHVLVHVCIPHFACSEGRPPHVSTTKTRTSAPKPTCRYVDKHKPKLWQRHEQGREQGRETGRHCACLTTNVPDQNTRRLFRCFIHPTLNTHDALSGTLDVYTEPVPAHDQPHS